MNLLMAPYSHFSSSNILLGGTGAYTETKGIAFIREQVANFILERDGYPASPEDIFLTNGASPAVQLVMRIMIRNEKDGRNTITSL
jgi:aspartate/methionine/tyrosine aminotransferase